jgi:hypothetical protein
VLNPLILRRGCRDLVSGRGLIAALSGVEDPAEDQNRGRRCQRVARVARHDAQERCREPARRSQQEHQHGACDFREQSAAGLLAALGAGRIVSARLARGFGIALGRRIDASSAETDDAAGGLVGSLRGIFRQCAGLIGRP